MSNTGTPTRSANTRDPTTGVRRITGPNNRPAAPIASAPTISIRPCCHPRIWAADHHALVAHFSGRRRHRSVVIN
ncbi:hypothetical protein [Nocardia lasii]|uniref:Uncharacterized protein n=1 Tax=Nocardia lasii TaxID=1616107 RepID=A0ABW1JY42_9NOCA